MRILFFRRNKQKIIREMEKNIFRTSTKFLNHFSVVNVALVSDSIIQKYNFSLDDHVRIRGR